MKMRKTVERIVLVIGISLFAFGALYTITAQSADWPQWQGPDRKGVSSETGLLKEWPEGGPKLLRSLEGIGKGYSSPSIANGFVYITGMEDNIEFLSAFDLEGNLKWRKEN